MMTAQRTATTPDLETITVRQAMRHLRTSKLIFADPHQLGCMKLIEIYRRVKADIEEIGDGWNTDDDMRATTKRLLRMNNAELEGLSA